MVINHNSVLSLPIFQNSINNTIENLPSEWIIYDSMVQNNHISLVNYCTLVTPITVALFSGQIKLNSKYMKDLEHLNLIRKFIVLFYKIININKLFEMSIRNQ